MKQQQASIKRSILWGLLSFTVILSCVFAFLILAYSWVVEDNVFNRMLNSEAQYIQNIYKEQGQVVSPRHPFMTLYASWASLPGGIALLKQQSPDRVEFPLPGHGTIHTKTVPLGDNTFVLAGNVSEFEVSRDYLPKLLPWMALSLVVISSIALVIGWYLSNSIIRPLQYLANTVKQHPAEATLKFERCIPENEIGYLAGVIESDFNRLQQTLAREADFTRDVSHELRTPVSVFKLILSRLQPQQPVSDHTLTQLLQYTQQFQQTIDILLALARDESVNSESLCLLEEIQQSLINHKLFALGEGPTLQLNVPADYYVQCNRNLLHLLLNNLLDNVAAHSAMKRLVIELNDNCLIFSNPAMPAVLQSQNDILEPGIKGAESDGIGQGLHLIRRICERFDWLLSVVPTDERFTVKINFRPS